MNTDHINYQQRIAQSVNEEKDHELLEKPEKTTNIFFFFFSFNRNKSKF